MARAPVSKTGGWGFESPPLLPGLRDGAAGGTTQICRTRLAACPVRRVQKTIMAKISPLKFMQEVRAETQKVTWPTRRETAITTIMVFVMVLIASVFFLVADRSSAS